MNAAIHNAVPPAILASGDVPQGESVTLVRSARRNETGLGMIETTLAVSLLGFALLGLATSIMESTTLRESALEEFDAHQRVLGIVDRVRSSTPEEALRLYGGSAGGSGDENNGYYDGDHGGGAGINEDIEIQFPTVGAVGEESGGSESGQPDPVDLDDPFLGTKPSGGIGTGTTIYQTNSFSGGLNQGNQLNGSGWGDQDPPVGGLGNPEPDPNQDEPTEENQVLPVRVVINYRGTKGRQRQVAIESLITDK